MSDSIREFKKKGINIFANGGDRKNENDLPEKEICLENNIQMALQQKTIELEDAIDLREIRNIKLANQMLKIRRKRKIDRGEYFLIVFPTKKTEAKIRPKK